MLKASWGDEPLKITGKYEKKEKVEDKKQEEAVDELAKFELEQREKEGDEAVLKELSKYWLKFKINQV